MLPVSGAEQLNTSGPKPGTRPMISHSGAYSDVGQPGAVLAFGQKKKQVPQARRARLRLQLLDNRSRLPPIAAIRDLAVKRRLVRIDVLVHERSQTPLQLDDFVGMVEAHAAA